MHGRGVNRKILYANLKERDIYEDIGIDGNILQCILKELDRKVWLGFIWLSIGTRGRLSQTKL
jgi:hypothetical protein